MKTYLLVLIAILSLSSVTTASAADMCVTVPSGVAQEVVDAFANVYHYQDQIDDGTGNMMPNPQSKAQFAKAKLVQFVKDVFVANRMASIETEKEQVLNDAKAAFAGAQ